MCLLLALVVLLMQKATDPRHVSNAFQALGVPLTPDEPLDSTMPTKSQEPINQERSGLEADLPSSDSDRDASPAAARWRTTCRDMLPRLLESASTADVSELGLHWFGSEASSGTNLGVHDELSESLLSLKNNAEIVLADSIRQTQSPKFPQAEQTAWLQPLRRMESQWQQLWKNRFANTDPTSADAGLDAEFAIALSDYLDGQLVRGLRDATPWTQRETTAFWRLIQRGQGGVAVLVRQPPIVNTLQLESEADAFRGQLVRFRGTARRIELVTKGHPQMAPATAYWEMWLRGEDDSVQPVAVYTSDPAAGKLVQQINPRTADFPAVEVTGYFAKRLAYASQAGVEVAPTLFATQVKPLAASQIPTATNSPTLSTDSPEFQTQLLIALVSGGLLAGILLGPIVAHFLNRSKHTRDALGKSSAKKTIVPTLLCWLAASGLSPTAPRMHGARCCAQDPPPWVLSPQDDPVAGALSEGLQTAFDPTAISALRDYLRGQTTVFPNQCLKGIQLLNKLGWPTSLEFVSPIETASDIKLASEQICGWVRLAMPVELDQTQRSWYQTQEKPELMRLEIQLQPDLFGPPSSPLKGAEQLESQPLVTVFCRYVPSQWLSSSQLRQPVRLQAISLRDSHSSQIVCAIAERPQWLLPEATEVDSLLPPVSPQYLQLAKHGWDLFNIDVVAERHQAALAGDEAEAFYSLMRIANRLSEVPSSTESKPLELLSQAKQSLGKPVRWRVRLVSGTVVQVPDRRMQEVLGDSAYVQFDGFVEIGNDRVSYQVLTADPNSQRIEFQGEFPITIVSRLDTPFAPPKKQLAQQASWQVGQYALLEGTFYRMWSYQSQLVRSRSSDSQARQLAPLIVASKLSATAPAVENNPESMGWFGWALCISVVGILAAIWIAIFSLDQRRPHQHLKVPPPVAEKTAP